MGQCIPEHDVMQLSLDWKCGLGASIMQVGVTEMPWLSVPLQEATSLQMQHEVR
jgi:hypothetical protein